MVTAEYLPHAPKPMQCYVHVKSQSRGKNTGSTEKFPSLVLPGNTTTDTAPYPISSLSSVSGHLRKVKNKRKFQTFSSKSGRGRLRELVPYKRFPM